MVLYIIAVIFCCIGGTCLGAWVNRTDNKILLMVGCISLAIGIIVSLCGAFLGKKKVKPERTTFEVEYKGNDGEQIIQKILKKYGFEPFRYADEEVYRLGSGFWTARKLLRYTVLEDKIVIVAWVAMGMGSRPNQELPLDDNFFACVPKKKLKKIVEEVIATIKKANNEVVQLNPVEETPVVEEVEASEEVSVTEEPDQKKD